MSGAGFLDLFRLPRRGVEAKPASPRPGLDGTVLFVPGDNSPIPVTVTMRPNAHRMVLRIDRRTGGASLTVPRGIGRVRAERFLEAYRGWLAERLKALPAQIAFIPDAIIPIRGEPYRIVHRVPFRGETRLCRENDEHLLVVHGDIAQVPARVGRFLRELARDDLARAVARRAQEFGVSVGRISVKDTRSRWGSCSARGDLAFSWRLILAPSFVLDYLAVHELAHRLEMNHSTRYWRHVQAICPEFELAEVWLKRHGPALHHYG